jgi:hypothetical protein
MPSQLIILVFGGLIWWLFQRERRNREEGSSALWVPLLWFLIIGSRSVSSWLGPPEQRMPGEPSGNALDTVLSLGLLLSGLVIVMKRRLSWGLIVRRNKWLFAYFAYAGISSMWADEPVASMKAWLKDAGNVVMVLIILSEKNPVEALKSFFIRSSFVLVLCSLMLVKYFPLLGRAFDESRGIHRFIGVSTNKNGLGATLLVCALGTVWCLIDLWRRKDRDKTYFYAHLGVLAVALWLLNICHSATSLACAVLGSGILGLLALPKIRNVVQRLGLSFFIIVPLLGFGLNYLFDLSQVVVWAVGRDLTFTGRTGIWEWCMRVQVNPVFGSGYSSFLTGERAITVAKGLGFFYALTEVHNGYLETYFNCGAVGLVLLVLAIFFGIRNAWQSIYVPGPFFAIRFAIVIVALIYNMSESAFSGPHQIWFLMLLALVEYPRPAVCNAGVQGEEARLGQSGVQTGLLPG